MADTSWMEGITWSINNTFAILMVMQWEEEWYSQERRRKGNWICCDRLKETEKWNG